MKAVTIPLRVLWLLEILVIAASLYFGLWKLSAVTSINWATLTQGIGFGLFFFATSLIMTAKPQAWQLKKLKEGFCRIQFKDCVHAIWRYGLITALYEELFWRLSLQSVLRHFFGPWIAVLLTASLFFIVHIPRLKGQWPRALEMAYFSMMLGFIFQATQNYWVLVIIHFLRNAGIVIYRFSILNISKKENRK